MTLDGISASDQEKYFNPGKEDEKEDESNQSKPNPALEKYIRMRGMSLFFFLHKQTTTCKKINACYRQNETSSTRYH